MDIRTALRFAPSLQTLRTERRYEYETLVTLYMDGSNETTPGMMAFNRPQDFATKGWEYHCFLFTRANQDQQGKVIDQTTYLVHAYVDVPMDQDTISKFLHAMCMRDGGLMISHSPMPYAPSDGLLEDDFWDETLGEIKWFDNEEDY